VIDLRELYQELILDHGRHPRNARFPERSNREAEGKNPLCGDQLIVKLRVEDGVVQDIGFVGTGCAISQAAASTMTEAVKGKSLADIETLFSHYHDVVTGKAPPDDERLGKLAAFSGVREFPMRVKCATLAWHTLQAAVEGGHDTVTTE
jgi:nitrogen fixation protein NifU and related proteins